MNKIITVAMAIMLGLTGFCTFTVYQQQQTITELRQDIDDHTSMLMMRAAMGSEYDMNMMEALPTLNICKHPSSAVKATCDSAKAFAK
ncbi:hypothetical protein [Aeromonas taiwanensis]